jgi:hypothetical protein
MPAIAITRKFGVIALALTAAILTVTFTLACLGSSLCTARTSPQASTATSAPAATHTPATFHTQQS